MKKSPSELSLLIERPGIPSYHGQIVAGLLRNDHNRVCLIQTQPQQTHSQDGTEKTYTQLTLMLTVDQAEVRDRSQSGALLPGHGVFWGFQEGPLNTLFGFDEGVYGEFRTQGRLVKAASLSGPSPYYCLVILPGFNRSTPPHVGIDVFLHLLKPPLPSQAVHADVGVVTAIGTVAASSPAPVGVGASVAAYGNGGHDGGRLVPVQGQPGGRS
ncbi:hypothetical protein PG984_006630 [Apiospora sp. TS-2023a]